MERYYYKGLTPTGKAVYDAMLSGMEALQSSVRIPAVDGETIADAYLRLKLDVPLLFYAVGYRYRFDPRGDHAQLLPEYLFEKSKVQAHRKAVDARIARITKPLMGLSPEKQEEAIHDFILDSVRYDKLKKDYSHEIIGPLTQGVGVCEGIAKTVKVLCDACGIDCITVLGHSDPEHGIRYRHIWNIVWLSGKPYHVDATFDCTLQKGMHRYDYLNLADRQIFRDHTPPVLPIPSCTDEKSFYYRKLSFTKPEDAENRFAQALRKKQTEFVFHWRGGGLNRRILSDLMERCSAAAAKRGLTISASVNLPQAVISISAGAAGEITVEQPDAERETKAGIPDE